MLIIVVFFLLYDQNFSNTVYFNFVLLNNLVDHNLENRNKKKTRKQKRVNNLKIRIKKQENEELFKLFITYYKFKISKLMSHMIIQVCDVI
jgi:hypothetical protein